MSRVSKRVAAQAAQPAKEQAVPSAEQRLLSALFGTPASTPQEEQAVPSAERRQGGRAEWTSRSAKRRGARIRCVLYLDGLDRYHGAGALVMTTGAVGMIVAACLATVPVWAGFLAGALPTFLLAALVHPEHA